MAELVDALVSGASVERRAGSSPVLGTKYKSDLRNTVFPINQIESYFRFERRNGGNPNAQSAFHCCKPIPTKRRW